MSCVNDYTLRFYNDTCVYLFDLPNVIEFEYGRQKNSIGTLTVTLDGNDIDETLFGQDYILELYRFDTNLNQLVLVDDTAWFLMKRDCRIDGCNTTIELTFRDNIELLRRRVVAWYAQVIPGYLPSHNFETVDDILRLIFHFNFTPFLVNDNNPDPARFPGGYGGIGVPAAVNTAYIGNLVNRELPISNTPFQSLAANAIQQQYDWQTVLNAMQETAKAHEIQFNELVWFDIVYIPQSGTTPANWEYNIWLGTRGTDRRTEFILSPDNGTLNDITITEDWENFANIVYSLGNGEQELRIVGQATGDLLLDKRFQPIEVVITSNADSVGAAGAEAESELFDRQQTLSIEAEFIETNDIQFERNFFYGDTIRLQAKNSVFDVELTEYNVKVDHQGREVTLPFDSITLVDTVN